MNSKGVRPQVVSNLSSDDCRKLLYHMAEAHMIIFDAATLPADLVSPDKAVRTAA